MLTTADPSEIEGTEATKGSFIGHPLVRRIITAAAGGTLTLWALFTTRAFPVFLMAVAIGVIGLLELIKIAGIEDRPLPAILIGLVCFLTPVFVAWATPPGTWPFWATVWVAYIAGCIGVAQGLRRGYAAPLSAAWLGAPLATILVTHQQTSMGTGSYAANAALMLLLPLWIGDSLAMFAGKAFGKNKLAPSISPSKTWEGAVANFLGCLVAACIIGQLLKLPVTASLLVGCLSGVLGQVGDLAQSALKRVSGIKDSGGALPGHGGVLDRMDSFLLSSVPCATVLWLMGGAEPLFRHKFWP